MNKIFFPASSGTADLSGIARLSRDRYFITVRAVPEPNKPLRRLVVHSDTGRFLKSDGSWTTDEEEAMNFNDITSLILACSKHRVRRAEVLLRFSSAEKFDVRLPLRSNAP